MNTFLRPNEAPPEAQAPPRPEHPAIRYLKECDSCVTVGFLIGLGLLSACFALWTIAVGCWLAAIVTGGVALVASLRDAADEGSER